MTHVDRHQLLRLRLVAALAVLLIAGPPLSAIADEDLTDLSLEALMDLEVTSVSKRAESRREAPAAITVITADDIKRAGHTSIPEALRLVPGVNVARVDSSRWAISVRGFNNVFANKLLVLIDGRSVYTPLFSGVYWDLQDLMLEDVERIEVVRGPGGTLWGANAVNGVINIITKSAKDTQGGLVTALAGNEEYIGGARWGGTVFGERGHYRAYMRGFKRDGFYDHNGDSTDDDWHQGRGGFRYDTNFSEQDSLTFQGDYYEGESNLLSDATPLDGIWNPDYVKVKSSGMNLIARWNRDHDNGAATQVQMYYDRAKRDMVILETRNTVDLELQHDMELTDGVELTLGGNYRWTADDLDHPSPLVSLSPANKDLHLGGVFLQGKIDFWDDRASVIAGIKLEMNTYTDFEYQPSLRSSVSPWDDNTFWGAVSRAVRTPSRADRDATISLTGPPVVLLSGNKNFRSEDLWAFEAGYRNSMIDRLTLDAAAFYFIYDDLQALTGTPILAPNPVPPPAFIPIGLDGRFTNRSSADSYGVELEVAWHPLDWLLLSSAYSYLHIDLDFRASNLPLVTGSAFSDATKTNPKHQVQFRSRMDLPWNLELDATVYYVGPVRGHTTTAAKDGTTGGAHGRIGSYWRGDLRLAWEPCENAEISFVGQNLWEKDHPEYGEFLFDPTFVPRSYYAQTTFRF